jgi:hypothetical protein
MTEEERETRTRTIREDLKREPVWGQLIERRCPELVDRK